MSTENCTNDARVDRKQQALDCVSQPVTESSKADEEKTTPERNVNSATEVPTTGGSLIMTLQKSPRKRRLSQTQNSDNDDYDADLPGASSLKRSRLHKLAFHPDVVDNSLWADLNGAKYTGEFYSLERQYPTLKRPRVRKARLRSPSPRLSSSSSEKDVTDNSSGSDALKDRSEFAILSIRGNLDASSKERDASMFYSVDKAGFVPHPPLKQWSICASRGDSSPRDMPDVDTPCGSPSLEERLQAMTDREPQEEEVSEDEMRRREALAKRVEDVRVLPFPGFTRPPNYDARVKSLKTKTKEEPKFDPFAQPHILEKPLSTEEVADYSYSLMKRIGDDREAKEAFTKLMSWRGQLGYEVGYTEGIRTQVTQLVRQAMEASSRDSPP